VNFTCLTFTRSPAFNYVDFAYYRKLAMRKKIKILEAENAKGFGQSSRECYKLESAGFRTGFSFFVQVFSGLIDYYSQINLQSTGDFQNGFQCRIPFAVFHVGDHLGRKSRLLGNKVFGELTALPLLLQKGNNLCTKYLNASVHIRELQEIGIDSAFHYGGIVLNCGRNG
jgi:hypothetical protein